MAEYNRVKIEDLYLTSDGTEIGRACKVDIPSLAAKRPMFRRTVVLPIEGPPKVQLFENLIGEQLSLTIFVIHKEEFDNLVEIIDAADLSDGIINIQLSGGDYGDFDLDCVLENFDQPSGEFFDGRIPGLVMTFRIASVNPIEEE